MENGLNLHYFLSYSDNLFSPKFTKEWLRDQEKLLKVARVKKESF